MKDRYIYKAKISNGDEKGQWIQGDLNTGDSLGMTIRTHDHSLYYGAKFVDPETVCQCLGQKDKNNKLIFEHDQYKAQVLIEPIRWEGTYWVDAVCRIVWSETRFVGHYNIEYIDQNGGTYKETGFHKLPHSEAIEIIGSALN